MCGICGIWGENSPERISSMLDQIRHRGPDDHGAYCNDAVSMGMARLAIIDLSPAGHQPMANPDQTIWIVFNGEIYNFQEERRLLEQKGYTFQSHSDTEVLLRMYEHYGDDFLLRLRGMFALAVYDRRDRDRLLIARDQMGIKPLLYARNGSRLIFASEIKALLATGLVSREIDPIALQQLLATGSVYQPRTMLQAVQMLPPAHRIILENGQERIERYWSLGVNRQQHLRSLSYTEWVEALDEALQETVRLQMVSDVPLGAFLSGGIDSSVLVAMMAQHAGKRLNTFSVGFEAEGIRMDESADAARTAEYLGTNHYAVLVNGEMVSDHIRNIARGLDQPSIDGVNSYFVSMAAREKVTVAISGTGGDEIFAGYPWFITMNQFQPDPLKIMARDMLATLVRPAIFDPLLDTRYARYLIKAREVPDFLTRFSQLYRVFGIGGAKQVLAPAIRKAVQHVRSATEDLMEIDELSTGTTIERMSALCLRGYMNNQLLRDIDAVSMIHSLEVRVPYLDTMIVDLALSMPDSAKIMAGQAVDKPAHQLSYRESGAKRVLIDVGISRLPAGMDTQIKRGFTMPFDAWLQTSLKGVMMDTLSENRIEQRGLFQPQAVTHIKQQFLDGKIAWVQPWLLMMIELWFQEVLEK
jgi:asparagine synthase (glutamine-hydrolysing)